MRAVGVVSIFLLISLTCASPRIVKRESGRSWGENDASTHKLARPLPKDEEKPYPTTRPTLPEQDLRGRNGGPPSNMPAMDPRARMAMMMQAAQMAQMGPQGQDGHQGAPRPQYGRPSGMPPMGMPPQFGRGQQGPMNGMPPMGMPPQFGRGQQGPMNGMPPMGHPAMPRNLTSGQGPSPYEMMMIRQQQAMMAMARMQQQQHGNDGSSEGSFGGQMNGMFQPTRQQIERMMMLRQQAMMAAQQAQRGESHSSSDSDKDSGTGEDAKGEGRISISDYLEKVKGDGSDSSKKMEQDPRMMQGPMMQDPRMMQGSMMQDPRMMMQDPRMMQGSMMQDPRMQGSIMQDPRMQGSMMQDPRMMQGSMMQDPSMMQGSMMQDPRMMMQDPRMMQGPMMQDPRMMQGPSSMQSQMYGGASPWAQGQPTMSEGRMVPLSGEDLKSMDLATVQPMRPMQGPAATPMPKLQAVMGVDSRLEQFRVALIKSFYTDLFKLQEISEHFRSQMKYKLNLLRQIEARMTSPLRAAIASDITGGAMFPHDAQSSIIITKLRAGHSDDAHHETEDQP